MNLHRETKDLRIGLLLQMLEFLAKPTLSELKRVLRFAQDDNAVKRREHLQQVRASDPSRPPRRCYLTWCIVCGGSQVYVIGRPGN